MNEPQTKFVVGVTPEQLPNDQFRQAYKFWLDARGADMVPLVPAIDPLKLPKNLLPDLSIISVEEGPKRFWVRLVGTRIVRAIDLDLTNTWGDDVPGGEEVRQGFERCIESRMPYYSEGPTIWSTNDYKTYHSLLLPFADAQGTIKRLLTYLQFHERSLKARSA